MIRKNLVNLNEHALNRNKYYDSIFDLGDAFIENCLLVLQCKYIGDYTFKRNENHWKSELSGICKSYVSKKLKVKNTPENREKIIRQVLLEDLEILSQDTIENNVNYLEYKEHTEFKLTKKFVNDLNIMINELIRLCAKTSDAEVIQYIRKF